VIGRIFAYWEVIFDGQIFENDRSSSNFWGTFFHGNSCGLILAKNWLGKILDDFLWGRCYHFKNIFAKKSAKKWRFDSKQS
jgi:hypothetical protein